MQQNKISNTNIWLHNFFGDKQIFSDSLFKDKLHFKILFYK